MDVKFILIFFYYLVLGYFLVDLLVFNISLIFIKVEWSLVLVEFC